MKPPVSKEQIAFDLLENIQASFAIYEVVVKDDKAVDLRMLWANQLYLNVVKLTLEKAVGMLFSQIAPKDISWIPLYGDVGLRKTGSQVVESYSVEAKQFIHVQAYSPAPGQVATVLHIRNRFVESEYEKDKEEKRIRAILGYIPEGLLFGELLYKSDGVPLDIHCLYVNQTFEIYEGLVANTLSGKNLYAVYPDKSKEGLAKCHEAVKENKELHYIKHDKSKRIIEVDIYPSGFNQVFVVQRDITISKNTEESLNNLQYILNGLDALIRVTDPVTKDILFVNDSLKRHYGIEINIVGQKCHKIFKSRDTSCDTCLCLQLDKEPDKIIKHKNYNSAAGRVYENIDRYIPWPDGRTVHLQHVSDITELVNAEREIEEKKKNLTDAEERIKLMLDATPLCCQLWSSDFELIDCNEAAVSLYGFKSKQEHIDRFGEILPEYQPDGQLSFTKSRMNIKKAITEGKCVFDWMHQLPDGTPIPSEVTLVRIKYKDSFVIAAYTRDLREIKILKEKAEEIYYDALTGIYNRRYLDEVLNGLIKSLSQTNGSLSLLMIDIDHFKLYNDTYGHNEGDNCLKTIAEILTKSITRETDFTARYGGEEFTVVLPHTDEDGARIIAEKLLENIRNAKIPHSSSKVAPYVTVSIGATTGKTNYFQSGSDYLKKADEMLYASKQGGRDRYNFSWLG
uniref:Diguanylate cyclase n=1 Tax=uncultured bacterium contig00042 TaxID=1181529 RepID=A0A806JZG1_9BACT|nr:diguanylate cyclase [uncultured bacterium contig00042]